jgi:hypothetical protein
LLRSLICLAFLLSLSNIFGQNLRFGLVWGQENITLDSTVYFSASGQKWTIIQASFYLSDFFWTVRDGKSISEPGRVELVQLGIENEKKQIRVPPEVKQVCFRFGLDSATQVSGRTDGALDPANGMYWAWNTGYIQCRLEGFSPDSKGKKGKFEFHLGGYAQPISTDSKVCLDLPGNALQQEIMLDLTEFMNAVDLKKNWSVLTPGREAHRLSMILGKSFRVSVQK